MIQSLLLSAALWFPVRVAEATATVHKGYGFAGKPCLAGIDYVRPYPWRIRLISRLRAKSDGAWVGTVYWNFWDRAVSGASFAF